MESAVALITELGFPIAAALGLGVFVWKLINRIIDGMETKLDTLDEKVQTSLDTMEERVSTKLDSQYGIIVSLIDNLIKGAAGQAVQCFNISQGFEESTALIKC